MKTCLVVIDVQNDYFPGGKMELSGSREAGEKIHSLIECFRKELLPVVHIQHVSTRPGASFFLPGTHGVEFHPLVTPESGEKVIRKHFPNSFRETILHEYLQELNASRIVVAGMMTHMCIDTSVRAASDLGYQVTLVGDCCATRDLHFGDHLVPAEQVHHAFLAALDGSFAAVIPLDRIQEVFG